MIRSCMKFCCENLLKSSIRKRSEVIKRAFFVPHKNVSESQLFASKNLNISLPSIQSFRHKGKKSKKAQSDTELDSNDEEGRSDEELPDKYTKILEVNVTTLRVDAILKSALGMARNKIETLFYESKIRVNGQKTLKKSVTVHEGDEIDVIKGPDLKNPDFINVARIEILSMTANEDNIKLKIKRCKSLTIESYEDIK